MLRLPWRARPDHYGQMVKLSCERGSPLGLHTHDYPELFWIDEGPCCHRINGTEDRLETGDLLFIRPSDRHQLLATPAGRFTMTNLECQPALIREMKRRFPDPFNMWFNERSRYPTKIGMKRSELMKLQQLAMELGARPPNALNIEGFCLDLARLLAPFQAPIPGIARCPEWLQDALLKAQFPAVFVEGPAGLFRAARKSPAHVSRLCQKFLRKTPTKLIETFRMKDAEQKLRLTSLSVTQIALTCGYSTTAQFHRAFKEHYRETPLRYRHWIRGG